MLMKRMIRNMILKMNEDDFDVDALLAMGRDDLVWDGTSELGIGETITGKKDVADWFCRWKEEFPKRTFEVKSICFSRWPLCLRNVFTAQWSCTETDKQGKTYGYDGVTVFQTRNFKCVRATEHISFTGLPKVSDMLKPIG